MSEYIQPIKIAVTLFPFLAFAISFVFFVIQYRRYGRFNLFRAIILYSFVFYLLCAYFLVILPLPPITEVAQYTGSSMELVLGKSAYHFFTETSLNLLQPSTYLPAMKESVFLEPVFNILLVVPLGIYLRYYFKQSLWKVVGWSFALSLFFELTQLSGVYFIYPHAYRLFDVNDLLHNTLGGLIGYLITPFFTFLLPNRSEIDEHSYETSQRVTYVRRAVAWAIDWLIIRLLVSGVTMVARMVTENEMLDVVHSIFYYPIVVILFFILLPYFMNGQTIGKKLVRIQIVEVHHPKIRLQSLVIRYGLLYFIYFGLGSLWTQLGKGLETDDRFQLITVLILLLMVGLLQLGFLVNVTWSILRKKRTLFYEKISHTYLVSTINQKS